MRNLLLFLTKNYYIILFLFLEFISILFIVQNNHFQRSHVLNSSNNISGNIFEIFSNITGYFNLKNENQKLAYENVALHNLLRQSFNKESKNKITVKDSLRRLQYEYVVAKVVNNSTVGRKNFITINAGKNYGIKEESAVICSEGVVGIVRDVSDNFSTIMSVLNENTRIPVTIKKFRENSILTWDGADEWHAKLERIPSNFNINKGDTIVTSAYSSIFPEGIQVGVIDEFEKISGNTFFDVTIKLSTDFSRLKYVNVVNNLMKEEQLNLENKSLK
jgi:rod shape-determining protein MreC